MFRKIGNAVLGFACGCVAGPVILVCAPFFFAWFLYNETDKED